MNEVSKEQIEQYKKEIASYPSKKKKLLILAIIFSSIGALFLIALIVLLITIKEDNQAGLAFILLLLGTILFSATGIALFIFRYEIYLIKTANRQRIIARKESEENETKHPHDENHKIGF